MLVKICGITCESAALAASEAGADFIGFMFAESKRKISRKEASKIVTTLPEKVKKVGVFVNASVEEMIETAKEVGLDVIQLHGDEDAAVAKELPYEIIKAFPAKKKYLLEAKNYPADYILIDTPSKTQRGGSGKSFDWSVLEEFKLDRSNVILAGGLRLENVRDGIDIVKPAGVDVSSGVEVNGRKDIEKIKEFIKHAK